MRTIINRFLHNRNAILNQLSKSNISGSQVSPHIVEIPIPITSDFKLPPVEILKKTIEGTWKKAVHGTDYNYTYPANDLLKVEFYTTAEFKINK